MSNGQHLGIYRAIAHDVQDPSLLGRVQVEVVSIPEMVGVHVWAMPCVPYAGADHGFYMLPEVGDQVWVTFEDGNTDDPVWMGSFWSAGELGQFPSPEVKVVKSAAGQTITFDGSDPVRPRITIALASGMKVELVDGDGTIVVDNGIGAKVELDGVEVRVKGWPMKFVPPAPGTGDLEARVAALEAAVQQMTQNA